MTKKIHILLSRESFEELENMKIKLNLLPDYKRKTYEDYLKKEKENPTMALFG